MREITYNSQRDNFDFAGTFKGSWQCFSTCSWMFLSWLCEDIDGADDEGLKEYFDDVESSVGEKGIAEEIQSKKPWIKGHSSTWYDVQKAGLEKWARDHGCDAGIIFSEKIKIDDLPEILKNSPIIIGTSGLGGLGGHMILLVDYDEETDVYKTNDPYGNALKKYKDKDGDGVLYPAEFLRPCIEIKNTGMCRCIYSK